MTRLAERDAWADRVGMACGWWRRCRPCRAAWRLLLSLSMLAPLLIPSQARATPPALAIDSDPVAMPCAAAGVLHAAPLFFTSTLASASGAVAGGDMIQASYRTDDWSGHLERRAWLLDGAGQPVPASPSWDAGALLTGGAGRPPAPAPALRTIYTSIVQPDGSLVMVPFEWARLSDAQRLLLDQAPSVPGATATAAIARRADGLGGLRLAWLRGTREQEGLLFRRRTGVLGDAVNANPVYVGAPSGTAAGDAYAAFYASHKTRRPVVYLGANDGMLHAFDAADGTELFAYVPDALMASLNQLPSLFYVHRAYVDGPAVAADALLGTEWKTVLVAAMGAGAQGVLALDVTDPELLATNAALWEFTDRDDPMMGNVLLPPQIARLRTRASGGGSGSASPGAGAGTSTSTSATFRYFAVVASGIDNVVDDGHRSSAGNGALFLLALDKPRAQPWKLNLNYYRLVTPAGDAALANALGAPALINDADGVLVYAYAGDLQGNLWRFDVSGNAPWSGAVGPGPGKQPLFTARDAAGARQPIAQQPKVVYAADGGYLVLFGTGRMITRADRSAASYAPQSYYAIRDTLATPPQLVTSRRQLTPRFLDGGTGAGTSAAFSLSGAPIEGGSMGWYIDFADASATGERSLNAGTLVDGALLFNTLLPAAHACDAVASRTYALDVLSGLPDSRVVPLDGGIGDSAAALVGLLRPGYAAAPVALALSRSVAGTDGAGRALLRRNFAVVSPGAGDVLGAALAKVAVTLPQGRLSWREVANWRELHQALKK